MTDAVPFHLDRPQHPAPSSSTTTRSKRSFEESAAADMDDTPASSDSQDMLIDSQHPNPSTPERSRKRPRSNINSPSTPPPTSSQSMPVDTPPSNLMISPERNHPTTHMNSYFPGENASPIDEDAEMDMEDTNADVRPIASATSGLEEYSLTHGRDNGAQTSQFEPVDDREGDGDTAATTPLAIPPVLPPVEALLNTSTTQSTSSGEAPVATTANPPAANAPQVFVRRQGSIATPPILGNLFSSFRRPSGAASSAESLPSAQAILSRPPNPLPTPPALIPSLAHVTRFSEALDPIRRSPPSSSMAHLDAARRSLFSTERPSGMWPPDLTRSPRPPELGEGDSDPEDPPPTSPPISPPAPATASSRVPDARAVLTRLNASIEHRRTLLPESQRAALPSHQDTNSRIRQLIERTNRTRAALSEPPEPPSDDELDMDVLEVPYQRYRGIRRFAPSSYDGGESNAHEPPFTPSILAGPSDDEQQSRLRLSSPEPDSDDERQTGRPQRSQTRRLRSLLRRMNRDAAGDEALLSRAESRLAQHISLGSGAHERGRQLRIAIASLEDRLRDSYASLQTAEERVRRSREILTNLVDRHGSSARAVTATATALRQELAASSSTGAGATSTSPDGLPPPSAAAARFSQLLLEGSARGAPLSSTSDSADYSRHVRFGNDPAAALRAAELDPIPVPPSPRPSVSNRQTPGQRGETIDTDFLTDFTSMTSLPRPGPTPFATGYPQSFSTPSMSLDEPAASPRNLNSPYQLIRSGPSSQRALEIGNTLRRVGRLRSGATEDLLPPGRRIVTSPPSPPLSPRTPGGTAGSWEFIASDAERRERSSINPQQEVSVVSPTAWDFAAAGYDRPEVSPLTPSWPLPGAPRLVPRNLSISELQHIRTGYTPQASRNNSIVPGPYAPPSPTPFPTSPAGGVARSMLLGPAGRSLERSIFRPDGGVSEPLTASPATTVRDLPWRGWTEDAATRTGPVSRPSITLTREHVAPSNSAPNPRTPELLLDGDLSPWIGRPSPLTAEPEAAPSSTPQMSRPRSVIDDYRRQLQATARARNAALQQRRESGWTPLTPTRELHSEPDDDIDRVIQRLRSPSPPPPPILTSQRPNTTGLGGPAETMVQRMNRMMNTQPEVGRQPLALPRAHRGGMHAGRSAWRHSGSFSVDRPHTPTNPINSSAGSSQPPAAPLDADQAVDRFVRSGPERHNSPSPTRPTNAADRYRSARRQRTSLQSIEGGQLYFDAFGGRDPWDSVFGPSESDPLGPPSNRPSLRRQSSMSLHDIFRETLRHEPDADIEMTLSLLSSMNEAGAVGGLHPSQIAQLPTAKYKDCEEAKREERCPICLDDYNEDDTVMGVNECKHYFHKDCFDQWLKNKRSCPYCRANIRVPRHNRRGGSGGTGPYSGFYNFGGPRGGPPAPPPAGPSSSSGPAL